MTRKRRRSQASTTYFGCTSLSHWASTFVCSMFAVIQRIARVPQRQLILTDMGSQMHWHFRINYVTSLFTTIFWSQQVITAVIIINSILLFLLCPGMQTMKNNNVRNRHIKKAKMVFEYNKLHSNPYLIYEYSVVALTHSQFKITHH